MSRMGRLPHSRSMAWLRAGRAVRRLGSPADRARNREMRSPNRCDAGFRALGEELVAGVPDEELEHLQALVHQLRVGHGVEV